MILNQKDEYHISGIIKSSLKHHQRLKKGYKTLARDLPCQDDFTPRHELFRLVDKMDEGVISKRQFMVEIMEWSYKYCFLEKEYIPVQLPTRPIQLRSLSEDQYEKLSEKAKEKLKEAKMKFIEDLHKAKIKNKSDRDWLIRMVGYFTHINDLKRRREIENRLKIYQGVY